MSRSKVVHIDDHMALSCVCGSVNFALLKSGRVECNMCGTHQSVVWSTVSSASNDAVKKIASDEREACAKLVETLELQMDADKYPSSNERYLIGITEAGCRGAFADAIRKQSNTEKMFHSSGTVLSNDWNKP